MPKKSFIPLSLSFSCLKEEIISHKKGNAITNNITSILIVRMIFLPLTAFRLFTVTVTHKKERETKVKNTFVSRSKHV
ncbi:hypothetical protein EfmAA290_23860 [Enterococcus faecium]|nr:hypothetical protein EfmAA290_23860 [Enterococcus faecium]